MRAFLKSMDDSQKEVELFVGKTTLGRGTHLNCSDNKVSRNHAFIEVTNEGEIYLISQHMNPCFYYSNDSNSTPKIIKKDMSQKLSDGDVFSILNNAYKYQIVILEVPFVKLFKDEDQTKTFNKIGNQTQNPPRMLTSTLQQQLGPPPQPRPQLRKATQQNSNSMNPVSHMQLIQQQQPYNVYNCNTCKSNLAETGYHCTICDDFDLCVTCYQRDGHNHPMDKHGFGDLIGCAAGEDRPLPGTGTGSQVVDLDGKGENPGGSSSNTSPKESRPLSMQRCIQSLVHACQCRDAYCRLPFCHKMKRVLQHAKGCKRKSNPNKASTPGCPVYKKLIALCFYHAKHCQENKCPVPHCINIKNKQKMQQLQQRLQQQQPQQNQWNNPYGKGKPMHHFQQSANENPIPSLMQTQPQTVSPAATNQQMLQQNHPPNWYEVAQNSRAPQQLPQQRFLGMPQTGSKPQQQSNMGSQQILCQQPSQQIFQQNQQQVLPQTNANQQKQQQQRVQLIHTSANTSQLSAVGQYSKPQQKQNLLLSVLSGNVAPQQQAMNIQSFGQQMQNPGLQSNSSLNSLQGNPTQQQQALQQLLATLKSPASPQQQQQVLSILKSNPALMAAFIKQRSTQQQQQQTQQQQMQTQQQHIQQKQSLGRQQWPQPTPQQQQLFQQQQCQQIVGQKQVIQPQQRLMAPQQQPQQVYGTVTQRFSQWTQNPSLGKPQIGPMMRSPPQQRLQTTRYMTS